MDDSLTELVIKYQKGEATITEVRNRIWLETYLHLNRYRRKGEDEVSEFLLVFHDRIEGLVRRFRCQGLPFRHYLLRTLRWQWNTFRADRARERRQAWVAADAGLGAPDDEVAEPSWVDSFSGPWPTLSDTTRKRLILLALKATPDLSDDHLELLSRQTGADLSWLQACHQRLKTLTDRKRQRGQGLVEKRGEALYRRLMAEDDAQREVDPQRREVHERRARLYRGRLANLARQQRALSTAPTHLELAQLLGIPKGSIDSGLYHLKKELACVYSGGHDSVAGDEQPPQKTRIRSHLSRLDRFGAEGRRAGGVGP